MRQRIDPRFRRFAREMRSDATGAEQRLWAKLRDGRLGGLKFRRQVPVGNAITDFVCYERKLIVELDGVQHDQNDHDKRRDAELRRRGFRILRVWNMSVTENIDGVLDAILTAAQGGELAVLSPRFQFT